ncbi:MAG: HDOD domain-containing protein [Eubacteriaceae bacterium]
MKKILFVDDEKEILRALNRAFFDKPYETIFAASGDEALDLLSKNTIDMVITDMRMPGMDGYSLLKTIKAKYPHILRVILSGYSEDLILIKSLKENVAKLYMYKPWNNDELEKIITNLFETEYFLKKNNIFDTLNNFGNIPTIESSYLSLIKMIDDGEDTNIIVKKIEKDQALTLNILRIANSAYYNLKAISIFKAVTYLGVNNIRNIIQATAILESIIIDKKIIRYFEVLWDHSYKTTTILNLINRKYIKNKNFDIFFTAGLLHNIGIVIMLMLYKDKYCQFLRDNTRILGIETNELEIDMFGHTHNQYGGFMLKWWDIPFPIVEAALYYHTPMLDTIINKDLVKAVYIANYYAVLNVGLRYETDLNLDVLKDLGIQKDIFEKELEEFLMGDENNNG